MKFPIFTFRPIIFALVFLLTFSMLPKTKAGAADENAPDTVFSNSSPIAINTVSPRSSPTTASLYPSSINVTGMNGNTTRVQVSLRGLTHPRTGDLDFLLVGPGGQKFIFLSDVPSLSVQDRVYTFADDAPNVLTQSTPFVTGFYKPVNFGVTGDTFPAPAPAAPYDSTTFANNFNGTSPNGTWSLFAVDDTLGGSGAIYSGWELTITTNDAPQTFANTNYIGFEENNARANPYPSVINVSGLSGVVSSLKVTLNNLSHTETQDIDVLLVSPNGSSLLLMSDTGAGAANNITLTLDDSATNTLPNGSALVSGTFKPTNPDVFDNAGDFFPPPAPSPPYYDSVRGLASFNNFSPNGTWQLYVIDDTGNNAGAISGGWSLDITTAPPVVPQAGCAFPSLAPSQFAVGSTPTNLAVGDFNNDSKPDLVVTNQASNNVSILLNDGNGGFLPQNTVAAGTAPYAVAVGLFNNDGNLDLAVINSGSNTVSIFLGSGSGTFSAPTSFATGLNPISITVGDFNNDSRQDLAIANFGGFFSGSISILSGNGSGGFSLSSTLRTDTQPAFVKAVNLNGDGNLDLVVASFGGNSVSTYFGDGNNLFNRIQNISTSQPIAVEIAEVTGDGNPDLIVANYNLNSAGLHIGLANGTFSTTRTGAAEVGANPASVIAADILGNGTNRLAFALSGTNQVAVTSALALNGLQQFFVGLNPNAIVKGDFNGDGKIDLATADSGSNTVTILKNACTAAKGNVFDFTGDRRTDIAVYRPAAGFWAFNGFSDVNFFGRDRDVIVPADYDGDLRTDLAVFRPETGTWIIPKTAFPATNYGTVYNLQFGSAADVPAPADFDGDGKADLTVFRPSSGFWYTRRSSDNSFQATQFGMNGDRPVAGDYDGDGKADYAVFRPSNGVWYILGSSAGFSAVQFGQNGDRAVPGDYDGDGKTDVAIFRDGGWYILKSSNGAFVAQNFGTAGDIPVPGDYESDGKFDLAVFRPSQGNWYILRSLDGGFQAVTYGSSTDIPIPSAYVR